MFCFSRLQAPVSGMFAFPVKVTTLHKGLAVEVSFYKEGTAIAIAIETYLLITFSHHFHILIPIQVSNFYSKNGFP